MMDSSGWEWNKRGPEWVATESLLNLLANFMRNDDMCGMQMRMTYTSPDFLMRMKSKGLVKQSDL